MKILASLTFAVLVLAGSLLFLKNIEPDKPEISSINETHNPIAVVVPHHDLAAELIDEILTETANRNKNIDNIILIGPDHKSTIEQHILTTKNLYDTEGRKISVNENNVDKIIESKYAKLSDEKIASEHSIGVVAPFVVKHFPDARITPIVVSSSTSEEMLNDYLDILKNIYTEKTLYVASVDFSHYLDKSQAEEKDIETQEIISTRNYTRLLQLNHENIDSPESILGVMKIADIHNRNKLEIVAHSNSTEFGATSTNVTTYFGLIFE